MYKASHTDSQPQCPLFLSCLGILVNNWIGHYREKASFSKSDQHPLNLQFSFFSRNLQDWWTKRETKFLCRNGLQYFEFILILRRTLIYKDWPTDRPMTIAVKRQTRQIFRYYFNIHQWSLLEWRKRCP